MTVTISHEGFGMSRNAVFVYGSLSERKALSNRQHHSFDYLIGETKPNYPLPAIADTTMILTIARWKDCNAYAWDGIWREDHEMPPFLRYI